MWARTVNDHKLLSRYRQLFYSLLLAVLCTFFRMKFFARFLSLLFELFSTLFLFSFSFVCTYAELFSFVIKNRLYKISFLFYIVSKAFVYGCGIFVVVENQFLNNFQVLRRIAKSFRSIQLIDVLNYRVI